MYAKIIIMGRLGHEPKASTTKSGKDMCKFSVAVDTGYGDSKKTAWYDVTIFGKRAVTCGQYLHKGSVVLVDGELSVDEYKGKDGTPRYSLCITANDVVFGAKSESSQEPQPQAAPQSDEAWNYDDAIF